LSQVLPKGPGFFFKLTTYFNALALPFLLIKYRTQMTEHRRLISSMKTAIITKNSTIGTSPNLGTNRLPIPKINKRKRFILQTTENIKGGFNSQVQLSPILFGYPVNFFRS
jgi:hypothetical protein